MNPKFQQLSRFGITAGLAWLVFVQVERRLPHAAVDE